MKKTANVTKHHRDFRSLGDEAQAELRRIAILNLDSGRDLEFVAELVDVHIQTVRSWLKIREDLKERDYKGKVRGRTFGEDRLISEKKEKKIQKLIKEKTPDKLNLGASLWTRRIVAKLISREARVKLHLNTVGTYLNRWGFTPQRPGKVANEQDKKVIKKWIEEIYSKIVLRAKEEDVEIHFSDETGVSLNTYYGRTYALKGRTPTIKLPAKKSHVSVISSMSSQGLFKFMIYTGGLNNSLFILFLKRLIKDSNKKIFLIVDNLSVHKSKAVKAFVEENKPKLEIFFPTKLLTTDKPNRVIQQYTQARDTL